MTFKLNFCLEKSVYTYQASIPWSSIHNLYSNIEYICIGEEFLWEMAQLYLNNGNFLYFQGKGPSQSLILHKMLTFKGTLNLSRFRENWDVVVITEFHSV